MIRRAVRHAAPSDLVPRPLTNTRHRNEGDATPESTSEGVAIQTTVGRLKRAFAASEHKMTFHRLAYSETVSAIVGVSMTELATEKPDVQVRAGSPRRSQGVDRDWTPA